MGCGAGLRTVSRGRLQHCAVPSSPTPCAHMGGLNACSMGCRAKNGCTAAGHLLSVLLQAESQPVPACDGRDGAQEPVRCACAAIERPGLSSETGSEVSWRFSQLGLTIPQYARCGVVTWRRIDTWLWLLYSREHSSMGLTESGMAAETGNCPLLVLVHRSPSRRQAESLARGLVRPMRHEVPCPYRTSEAVRLDV